MQFSLFIFIFFKKSSSKTNLTHLDSIRSNILGGLTLLCFVVVIMYMFIFVELFVTGFNVHSEHLLKLKFKLIKHKYLNKFN